MARRLAALDIGTNTVHVLVADAVAGGLDDVAHYVEMPEVGRWVERDGRVGREGTHAVHVALDRVIRQARAHGYEHLVAGATEALRRAADRDQVLAGASAALGVPVRLIPEAREAELSFLGAALRHAVPGDWLLADIGGGSTELVPARDEHMLGWVSLPVGSGIGRRFLSDPPSGAERSALRESVAAVLARGPDRGPEELVVTGGTAGNLPLVLSATAPPLVIDSGRLDEATIRLDDGPAQAVAAATGLSEARIRALRGGVEILRLLLDRHHLPAFSVSYEGLRHGMLREYLRVGDGWWRETSGDTGAR